MRGLYLRTERTPVCPAFLLSLAKQPRRNGRRQPLAVLLTTELQIRCWVRPLGHTVRDLVSSVAALPDDLDGLLTLAPCPHRHHSFPLCLHRPRDLASCILAEPALPLPSLLQPHKRFDNPLLRRGKPPGCTPSSNEQAPHQQKYTISQARLL